MIPKPQRDDLGRVQGEFYPLQKPELIALFEEGRGQRADGRRTPASRQGIQTRTPCSSRYASRNRFYFLFWINPGALNPFWARQGRRQKIYGIKNYIDFCPLPPAFCLARRACKSKLINNAAFVHLARLYENPYYNPPIAVVPKEFACGLQIPESSVYEAIAKLKEAGFLPEWVRLQKIEYTNTEHQIRNTALARRQSAYRLKSELGGQIEVITAVGRIDLLTSTEVIRKGRGQEAGGRRKYWLRPQRVTEGNKGLKPHRLTVRPISWGLNPHTFVPSARCPLPPAFFNEIKNINDWKEALGKILAYSSFFPNHSKRIHLFGKQDLAKLALAQGTCSEFGVAVTFEEVCGE